jgi:hypothetical protein
MPEVTFTFDSASAYGAMLDEIGQLGLDAHELLAHMYRYAGESDEDADARGAQVAKPVASIRQSLEGVHAGLAALRSLLQKASQAIEDDEKRRQSAASRLKI